MKKTVLLLFLLLSCCICVSSALAGVFDNVLPGARPTPTPVPASAAAASSASEAQHDQSTLSISREEGSYRITFSETNADPLEVLLALLNANAIDHYDYDSQNGVLKICINSANISGNRQIDEGNSESSEKEDCIFCGGTGKCGHCIAGSCEYCDGKGVEYCDHCFGTGRCQICFGSGGEYSLAGGDDEWIVCTYCGGSGKCDSCNGYGDSICLFCNGSGNCKYCSGAGFCLYCGGTGKQ